MQALPSPEERNQPAWLPSLPEATTATSAAPTAPSSTTRRPALHPLWACNPRGKPR